MAGTLVWAWPLKRAVFARLAKVSTGELSYPGAEALLSVPPDYPVQVELALPREPDRVCVYGTPVSFSRRESSGESAQGDFVQSVASVQVEVDRIEVRVRVYEPGDDFESVNRTLGNVCSAVTTAIQSERFGERMRIYLAGGTEDPMAMHPAPEPYVVANAILAFTAEVVTF